MKTRKASRAFDAEIKRDCAWFRSNPAKTRLRRKVTGQELPRHLRRLGIVEVVIERAGPAKFVRTFFARDGWALASGIDELEDEAVPGAPGHTISVIPGGQAVVDRADVTSADREYFEQNPDSDEYEREALPIELDQAGSSPKFGPRSGRVRVRRLAKGLRVRQLLRTCQ
jgi:hypothetical protein